MGHDYVIFNLLFESIYRFISHLYMFKFSFFLKKTSECRFDYKYTSMIVEARNTISVPTCVAPALR
jgi:hypothetical protein